MEGLLVWWSSLDITSHLVEASYRRDKGHDLAAASRGLVRARVLVRLARQLRCVSEAQHLHFVKESDEVGRMLAQAARSRASGMGGWEDADGLGMIDAGPHFMVSGARVHSLNVMAAITLEIPEDIVAGLRFPPARASEELRREFAVFLVKEGILPRHQARKLAAMDRIAFDDLLAHRQVAWESTAAEVFADADAVDRILDK